MEESVEEALSELAVEYADDHIGMDVEITALCSPPIPRDKVEDYASGDVKSHLYDLTDIALSVNHSGDVIMDRHVTDGEQFSSTDDSIAEIKVARGALIASFNRELEACAERLGIDTDERTDVVTAIREELGYSVDMDVEEEWTELDDE